MKELQQKNIVEDVTLEVLSPLHIGGAFPEINPLLYVYDGTYAVVMNERKFAEKLVAKKEIDSFIDHANTERPSLNQFFLLTNRKSQSEYIKACCQYKIPVAKDADFRPTSKFRQLTRFEDPNPRGGDVKTGEKLDPGVKNIYIPGSSIKGAIREAFLSHSIAQDPSSWDEYKSNILGGYGEHMATIDKLLRKGEDDPRNDILKFFRISDAVITKRSRCDRYSEIKAVKVISVNNRYEYHVSCNGYSIFAETVMPNIKFVCTVTIDIAGLEAFCTGLNRPKDECSRIADMLKNWKEICLKRYSALLSDEIDFFKKVEATEPDSDTIPKTVKVSENLEKIGALGVSLRLGWGSGILSTTQLSEIDPDDRVKIREMYCDARQQRNTPIFPQSRKVVWNGKEYVSTLGWVKISSQERNS